MNVPIRCAIIDDEPLAIRVIENYLSQMKGYEVIQTFPNALEAYNSLDSLQIDLLFLDINMPMLNGMDFIKSLKNAPKVIFTTAYREYAVEGFEVDAIDYLVKPIPFQRFLQALQKAETKLLAPNDSIAPQPSATTATTHIQPFTEQFIFLKVDKKMVKVFLKDIQLVESLKDYIKVITTHDTLVVHQTLVGITETLPSEHFMRIHRSYTIGLRHLEMLEGNFVVIAGRELPIGRNYQQEVKEAILNGGLN